MKKKFLVLITLILVISLLPACQSAEAIKEKSGELNTLQNNKTINSIDKMCEDYYKESEFVGMSVAIIKNGKVNYLNYGKTSANKDEAKPTDENTIYEIASISKTFAGTLLASETLKGKVSLDDPVQKYFSYPIAGEYDGAVMTLETLATHTSGLPRVPTNWRDGPNPYKNYTREKLDKFMQKFVLDKKPGVSYSYSNLAFGILGCILEDVENKSYEQLLEETITNQLDMKSTKLVLDDKLEKRRAQPYATKDCTASVWDFDDSLQACAGIKSTTRDLARYIAANMGQIKCDENLQKSFDMAQEIHYKGNMTIGLAWRYATVENNTILEHDGLSGGYTSYTAFNKDKGVGVVVLCNSQDGVIPLGQSIMGVLMRNK